jgi:hypothetical protein
MKGQANELVYTHLDLFRSFPLPDRVIQFYTKLAQFLINFWMSVYC